MARSEASPIDTWVRSSYEGHWAMVSLKSSWAGLPDLVLVWGLTHGATEWVNECQGKLIVAGVQAMAVIQQAQRWKGNLMAHTCPCVWFSKSLMAGPVRISVVLPFCPKSSRWDRAMPHAWPLLSHSPGQFVTLRSSRLPGTVSPGVTMPTLGAQWYLTCYQDPWTTQTL